MITILHGDNQTASRARFSGLKEDTRKKGKDIVALDGKTVKPEEIFVNSQTNSLLGQSAALFIEDFFSRKKKIDKEILNLDGDIVFWEGREISKTMLNSLPKTWKIESFPVPNSVFKFLESLSPNDLNKNITLFYQLTNRDSQEMLLPLLSWHVRQLIWTKVEPQTLSVPSWRAQKLKSQAQKFTEEELYELHTRLLQLDRDIKTGNSPLPLASSLDLVVASI